MIARLARCSRCLGINLVPCEARCCPWPRGSWILARRCHFSHHDYSSPSGGWLWLDIANLCFPDTIATHIRKSHRALSDSANQKAVQLHGFCPSLGHPDFLASDGGCLLLLLLVKLRLDSSPLLTVIGGMFVPFTFIVVEAQSHGMSSRLANYLVPILNGARSVLPYQASSRF